MISKLTTRQAQMLDAIIGYVEQYGYLPTIMEIGAMVGLHKQGGIESHLEALNRKRYIKRTRGNTPRATRILRFSDGTPARVTVTREES